MRSLTLPPQLWPEPLAMGRANEGGWNTAPLKELPPRLLAALACAIKDAAEEASATPRHRGAPLPEEGNCRWLLGSQVDEGTGGMGADFAAAPPRALPSSRGRFRDSARDSATAASVSNGRGTGGAYVTRRTSRG